MPSLPNSGKLRIDDNSLNFDYAHFLPHISKCSTIHGHSSRVEIEVEGVKDSTGIIVDFGYLKSVVREAISKLDHKIFVCKKYVVGLDGGRLVVAFSGRDGEYRLELPASQAFVADFESTVENIATYISEYVMERMPENVTVVRVCISEGIGKSAETTTTRRRDD